MRIGPEQYEGSGNFSWEYSAYIRKLGLPNFHAAQTRRVPVRVLYCKILLSKGCVESYSDTGAARRAIALTGASIDGAETASTETAAPTEE